MLLSVALLLVSLACGTESTESTQISDATDGKTDEVVKGVEWIDETEVVEVVVVEETGKYSSAREVDKNKLTDVAVISHIKNRLADETECGFLRDTGDWTAEHKKTSKTWAVSVTLSDAEGGDSYSWKYFYFTEDVRSGQDECFLSGAHVGSGNNYNNADRGTAMFEQKPLAEVEAEEAEASAEKE